VTAPTPVSPTDASGATGSADPSATVDPSATPPSPPAALAQDAVPALQRALAAEQAAVWAYGLVAAYSRDDAAMIDAARSGHLLRRDATAARLVAGGAEAPEPAAAYLVPVAVVDAATARQLAQDIESDAAGAWRGVIGSTDDPELRGFALLGLSDAAVRLAMWKQVAGVVPATIPFPGQP
jgi:hypothetical protein